MRAGFPERLRLAAHPIERIVAYSQPAALPKRKQNSPSANMLIVALFCGEYVHLRS